MGVLVVWLAASAGFFAGVASAAVVAAAARRRREVAERLAKAYTPILTALTGVAAAEARVKKLQDKLMAEFSSESSPYAPAEKKAAAEAFLAAEAAIAEDLVRRKIAAVRDAVSVAGHLLDDDDYLALTERLNAEEVAAVLSRVALPRELRDPRPTESGYGEILETIRQRYYELNAELRAPTVTALLKGLKSLFSSYPN